jgi:drug/metabolite transporter (DMT)-like permease
MTSAAHSRIGIVYAIAAAALFGLSTPLAKSLLGSTSPFIVAGLLYLGSGLGLLVVHGVQRAMKKDIAPIPKGKWPWLFGAILFGGVVAPVLLMTGLARTTGSTASLLLNLEGVFTAVIAWTLARENADRRIVIGMIAILLGGAVLSWTSDGGFAVSFGALFIAGACLSWAIDNNLTQAVSSADAVLTASLKGLVAGAVNVIVGVMMGSSLPTPSTTALTMLVGFGGYGVSLVCFILALRHVGTARTGAYFAVAPFVGAGASFLFLTESPTVQFAVALALMGVGVWIHVTERHEHEHKHEPMTHTHRHVHDEHHQHAHAPGISASEPHTHEHTHGAIAHSHLHWPDIHHRHVH